jgi:hypothetical protein
MSDREHPETVVLQLEDPAGPVERLGGWGGEHQASMIHQPMLTGPFMPKRLLPMSGGARTV